MATKQKLEAGSQKLEFVIKRGFGSGDPTYLTARGGWTNNPELAQVFPSEGAAKGALRKRQGEIVTRHQF